MATRSSRTPSSPTSSTGSPTIWPASSATLDISAGAEQLRGRQHAARLQPPRPWRVVAAGAVARLGTADRGGRARWRLPDFVALVGQHRPGRDRPADPRRRHADPDPQAAPAHGVQLDVGTDRLHRCQRCDADHPGTHVADSSPNYGQAYDSIPAEMARGSVLIWHGSLWHGGGANQTDERRVGIAMNYCAGYIRQQENQQLGLGAVTGAHVPAPASGTRRLRHLQRPHRPHRQEGTARSTQWPTPARWCGTRSDELSSYGTTHGPPAQTSIRSPVSRKRTT